MKILKNAVAGTLEVQRPVYPGRAGRYGIGAGDQFCSGKSVYGRHPGGCPGYLKRI